MTAGSISRATSGTIGVERPEGGATGRHSAAYSNLVEAPTTLEVSRVESATGWWEMVRGSPDARLGSRVVGLCGYRERSQAVVERHMAATSKIPLILSFGDTIEVDMAGRVGDSFESFVAGFHPGPATTRYQNAQHGLQVDLTPLGAYGIFGVPGSAFAGQIVSLDDVAPRLGDCHLQDRLASLRTWRERFAVVNELLLSLADTGPEPDPMVTWMWQQIERSQGRIRIADLVGETGRSHRHVTSRFHTQVGLTPKAAARVLRFEHAAQLVCSGSANLAELAMQCGYADQSHLTRDFSRLAGCSPGAFARADLTAAT
jgi:AraC-like DNA-binding protein